MIRDTDAREAQEWTEAQAHSLVTDYANLRDAALALLADIRATSTKNGPALSCLVQVRCVEALETAARAKAPGAVDTDGMLGVMR